MGTGKGTGKSMRHAFVTTTFSKRGKNLGHSDLDVFREQKFRTEFPYFSGEKQPEFSRKRDLYEPLLTAMAQVLLLSILANYLLVSPRKSGTKNEHKPKL